MRQSLSRRAFGRSAASMVGSFSILHHARGEEALRIRCSLDTLPSHVRNQSVVDYLNKVEAATGGQIANEVFHSGELYADADVAEALRQGWIDMAVPGAWTQTDIVPDCDFCQLPAFYGRGIEVTERAADGKPGDLVVRRIESSLRVKVIGSWIDLGFQNWYTTRKPLKAIDDIRGLTIRGPGGAGTAWRIGFFGGIPTKTAWPDVPLALSRGIFDGFVSTNESCATAKLWEAGVKYSYQDHQCVGQYMPLISQAFWSKLTPDVRKLMIELWVSNVSTYRVNAYAAQARARGVLEDNSVIFVDPSPEVLAASRKRMQTDVATLIRSARLSTEIVMLSEESANGAA